MGALGVEDKRAVLTDRDDGVTVRLTRIEVERTSYTARQEFPGCYIVDLSHHQFQVIPHIESKQQGVVQIGSVEWSE